MDQSYTHSQYSNKPFNKLDLADFCITYIRIDQWCRFQQLHFTTRNSARDSEITYMHFETRRARTKPFQSRLEGIEKFYYYITSRNCFRAECYNKAIEASRFEQEGLCDIYRAFQAAARWVRNEIRILIGDVLGAPLLFHSRLGARFLVCRVKGSG